MLTVGGTFYGLYRRIGQDGSIGEVSRDVGHGSVMVCEHGVVFFEDMAREDAAHAFVAFDDTAIDEFFDAGDGCAGGRFGADACFVDDGFGIEGFLVGDFFHDAVGGVNCSQSFFPTHRISDTNGGQ